MTPKQRKQIVGFLRDACTLSEAAAIVGVPWPSFTKEWIEGRSAHEAGTNSALGNWYRDAQRARAQCRAELKALANAAAGSREAGDRLALLQRLDAEAEPELRNDEQSKLDAMFQERIASDPELLRLTNALIRRLTELDAAVST